MTVKSQKSTGTTCKKCGGQMKITTIGTLKDKVFKCSYCDYILDIPDYFAIKEIKETDFFKDPTGQKIKEKTTKVIYRADEALDGNKLLQLTNVFLKENQSVEGNDSKQVLTKNSYEQDGLLLDIPIPVQGTPKEIRAAIIQYQENTDSSLSDEEVDSLTNHFTEMMAEQTSHEGELVNICQEDFARKYKIRIKAHLKEQEAIVSKYDITQGSVDSLSKDFITFTKQEIATNINIDPLAENFNNEETRKALIPKIEQFKASSREKYSDSINEELLDNITQNIFHIIDMYQTLPRFDNDKSFVYMAQKETTHEVVEQSPQTQTFLSFTALILIIIALIMIATVVVLVTFL